MIFDGDEAGLAAAQRAAESADNDAQVDFHVGQLPTGQDPASLMAGGKTHQFRAATENAVPMVHFLIDRHVEEVEPGPDGVARLLHQIGPLI